MKASVFYKYRQTRRNHFRQLSRKSSCLSIAALESADPYGASPAVSPWSLRYPRPAATTVTCGFQRNSMKPTAIIGGLSVLLAGLITNAPPVRSRLKTPTARAVAAGLIAAVIVVAGVLIVRLVFNTDPFS